MSLVIQLAEVAAKACCRGVGGVEYPKARGTQLLLGLRLSATQKGREKEENAGKRRNGHGWKRKREQ